MITEPQPAHSQAGIVLESPLSHILPPGAVAPDFCLPNQQEGEIKLSDLRGQPVILAFSPSHWNPDHLEHLALFNQLVDELQPYGAHLLNLRMQGIWCNLDFDDHDRFRFPVLSELDPGGGVAHAYGVEGESALFLVDEEGIVQWSQILPPGLPPRSEEVLNALRALKGEFEAESQEDVMMSLSNQAALRLSRRNFMATALAASLALALPAIESRAQSFAPPPTKDKDSEAIPSGKKGSGTVPVTLNVNGTRHRLNIEPRTSLLDTLREDIGLTGTKKGCNAGACGACTVLVNGQRINSCLTLAVMHEGEAITTVEGLAKGDELHPVQAAFIEHDGFQCGYCTSGQVVSAVACIKEGHTGSEAEIREWMSGNICRCGAYPGIVAAVKAAAQAGKQTA